MSYKAIKKVGLEAEYVLLGEDGDLETIPVSYNRDSFPLLGEIRGKPGVTWFEAVSSFQEEYLKTLHNIESEYTKYKLSFAPSTIISKDDYKTAIKSVDLNQKEADLQLSKNIYGTRLDDFSDQIVADKKITGYRISCGLHVHFSYSETVTKKIERSHYEKVSLPISLSEDAFPVSLDLYKKVSEKEEVLASATVSKLTRPAIYEIVRSMDSAFFERFAPTSEERTKFRQPGFYENKVYGFEYRSLPASDETIKNLPEITKYAFKLLDDLDNF